MCNDRTGKWKLLYARLPQELDVDFVGLLTLQRAMLSLYIFVTV
jgi:hypothetical protein